LKAAHTGRAELRVGRKRARSPLVKLSRRRSTSKADRAREEGEVATHLRKAILSLAVPADRCARSR